jgi:hypothetical protein
VERAFDDCDVAEFKRLLIAHPDHQRNQDGADA